MLFFAMIHRKVMDSATLDQRLLLHFTYAKLTDGDCMFRGQQVCMNYFDVRLVW
jgi:hypothetical protein